MLTEEETARMHEMCNELEKIADTKDPERALAVYRLRALANSTGDEWERLVRQYLAERAASQPNGDRNG